MRELSDDEVFGTAKPVAIKAPASPVELSDADVFGAAPPTANSWTDNLRDPLAGVLKIGPTALKGVADLVRLATGDSAGVGLSNAMQEGMQSIDQTVGSDRLRAQKAAVSNVLQSDDFGIGDIPGMIADNPRAAIDAGVSTIGSMFLPTGVAAGAVRALPSVAKVLPAAARLAPAGVATGATVGTGAAMNAAETFADTEGQHPADRYKGAAISGAASLALGKLLGGGAEGLVARRLAGELGKDTAAEIAKSAAKTAVKEGVQEFGEEGSNTIGKQVGKNEDINLNAALKSGAYGAAIGAGVGGGTDVATNARALQNAPASAPEIDPNAPPVAEPATQRGALSDRLDALASRMESEGKTDQAREYRVQAQEARNVERDRSAVDNLLKEAQDAEATQPTNPAQAGQAPGAVEGAAGQGLPAAGAPALETTGLKPKQEGPVLQNRDRSTPSSVAQMQSIAADPDYGRLGYSRDFANGAPVVAGGQVDPQHMGTADMAVASDGRRIPVQYAVVEADTVLPSNTVDGSTNAEYASATDRMRAIAGNGRIAGLQAAAQRGTTTKYRQELAADTMHGIDPQVIAGMRAPVLVRVMPQDQVSADIGDVSNTTGNLQLSAVEQANNDSQRVDLSALEFAEDGGVTAQAVRQFVQGMPQSERGALLDTNGQPTKQAVDRLHAAVFSRAYGNDQLVRLYAQAQDPEALLILSALAKLAPKFARLEGAGALDIRSVVTEAAEIAVNARRNGTPLAQAAAQIDMTADPLVGTVLQLFARNPRSNREVIEQLGNVADMAYAEANKPAEDMFGAVPRASRDDVLNTLEPQSNERASPQNLEQPAGSEPVQLDVDQSAAQPAAPADTGPAEAGRASASETGAASASQVSDSGANDVEAQSSQQQGAINTDATAAKSDAPAGLEDGNAAGSVPDRQSQGAASSTGNTTAAVTQALTARFGKTISAMERRGFLKISERAPEGMSGVQGMYDGKTVHLFADNIQPGDEVGVFLHEAGEHASMEAMLGDRYAGLVARANELVAEGDPDALAAQDRIPADTAEAARDSELVAYMIETVANKKPLALTAKARRWLADVVAGVRAWWSQTAINRQLEKYGQGIDLTPADIAALAERAVYWQENQAQAQDGQAQAATKTAVQFSEKSAKTPADISKEIEAEFPGVKLDLFGRAGSPWVLSRIVVPSGERDTGTGTKIMQRVIAEADKAGATVALTPSSDFGGNKKRLGEFYKRFGFVENKGRNKDYEISESMYRMPQVAPKFSKARSTTGGNANALTQTAAAPWNVTEPGTGDAVIRAMQNNKIDLKRLRDELEKQYGQLSDKADAYLNEELYHGKVAARVEALHEEVVKPILGKIAVAGKNAGVTVDDVNLYLHSRHAAERNAAMKAINPNMANNDALSGMSDQEAASNIARLRADGKLGALQTIAADIDNLIADTRTNLVADGLEDAAVVQAWESAYQHYVPLQRDVEGQGGGASKGMGFSVKGPEAKRAMGSNREVVNIFANIVAQAETGLIRAEKTKVGRSLLELANQFPNKDFWQVDTPPTKPRINKDTGLVERNAIDPLYQTADNVVMVKDNGGEVHYIVFNEKNERAKEVARAMKNLGIEQLPWAIQQVGHGTRFIASLLTARNPLFWFTNFARDVQGVLLNLEGTEAAGLQHKVLANMPKAFKGMHSLVRGKGQGQWAQYAKEMQDAGGTTGYMQQFENSDKRMGELRTEVARMQQGKADPRKLARTMLDFVDDYNDIVENAVRLAAYKTARDAGATIPRAASLAKNITVNFNRKGNATPVINSLYMFFNASLQGTARMAEAIVKSRKAQAIVGGVAAMGFILDMFNRMAAGDDDETGRNRYDMIPEFEKSKNWIIWNPMREGEYIKVPLPLGPHVFHNAGRLISDAINRDDPRDAAEYGWAFAGTLFDAFSPLGGAQSMAEMVAPSVVDPIIQLENNKSFTGGPVYKSADRGFGPDDPRPAYTRYFESTPDIWKQASKMLNDASGGDDVKKGAINIEPDILKHIAYTFTGGPGRTIDQAIDTAQGVARGKEVTTNRIPFVSRFYGENDDRQRDRIYYDDKKRVEEAKAAFDFAIKSRRRDVAIEVAKDLGDGDYDKGVKMMRNAKGTNRELMLINKRIKLLREKEQKGENVVREMSELQKRRTQAMSRNTKRNDDEPGE